MLACTGVVELVQEVIVDRGKDTATFETSRQRPTQQLCTETVEYPPGAAYICPPPSPPGAARTKGWFGELIAV